MNRVGVVIQARMGSSRLPEKVLKPLMGKSALVYQIERLRRVSELRNIIVATSDREVDGAIEKECQSIGVDCFRGSESDVLLRFFEVAKQFELQTIIRITGDCPFIDPILIKQGLIHFEKGQFDYVSNVLQRTWPMGMEFEVFSLEALVKTHEEAENSWDREHVTPYIYQHPEQFLLENIEQEKDESKHRFTLDTAEDYQVLKELAELLSSEYPDFSCGRLVEVGLENSDLLKINQRIEHKKAPGQGWGSG